MATVPFAPLIYHKSVVTKELTEIAVVGRLMANRRSGVSYAYRGPRNDIYNLFAH